MRKTKCRYCKAVMFVSEVGINICEDCVEKIKKSLDVLSEEERKLQRIQILNNILSTRGTEE